VIKKAIAAYLQRLYSKKVLTEHHHFRRGDSGMAVIFPVLELG